MIFDILCWLLRREICRKKEIIYNSFIWVVNYTLWKCFHARIICFSPRVTNGPNGPCNVGQISWRATCFTKHGSGIVRDGCETIPHFTDTEHFPVLERELVSGPRHMIEHWKWPTGHIPILSRYMAVPGTGPFQQPSGEVQ